MIDIIVGCSTGYLVHLSGSGSSFQSTKCWKMKGDSPNRIRNEIRAQLRARDTDWVLFAFLTHSCHGRVIDTIPIRDTFRF